MSGKKVHRASAETPQLKRSMTDAHREEEKEAQQAVANAVAEVRRKREEAEKAAAEAARLRKELIEAEEYEVEMKRLAEEAAAERELERKRKEAEEAAELERKRKEAEEAAELERKRKEEEDARRCPTCGCTCKRQETEKSKPSVVEKKTPTDVVSPEVDEVPQKPKKRRIVESDDDEVDANAQENTASGSGAQPPGTPDPVHEKTTKKRQRLTTQCDVIAKTASANLHWERMTCLTVQLATEKHFENCHVHVGKNNKYLNRTYADATQEAVERMREWRVQDRRAFLAHIEECETCDAAVKHAVKTVENIFDKECEKCRKRKKQEVRTQKQKRGVV